METKRGEIFKKEGVVNANSVVEKEQREFKHAENRYVVGRIDSESHTDWGFLYPQVSPASTRFVLISTSPLIELLAAWRSSRPASCSLCSSLPIPRGL